MRFEISLYDMSVDSENQIPSDNKLLLNPVYDANRKTNRCIEKQKSKLSNAIWKSKTKKDHYLSACEIATLTEKKQTTNLLRINKNFPRKN